MGDLVFVLATAIIIDLAMVWSSVSVDIYPVSCPSTSTTTMLTIVRIKFMDTIQMNKWAGNYESRSESIRINKVLVYPSHLLQSENPINNMTSHTMLANPNTRAVTICACLSFSLFVELCVSVGQSLKVVRTKLIENVTRRCTDRQILVI